MWTNNPSLVINSTKDIVINQAGIDFVCQEKLKE